MLCAPKYAPMYPSESHGRNSAPKALLTAAAAEMTMKMERSPKACAITALPLSLNHACAMSTAIERPLPSIAYADVASSGCAGNSLRHVALVGEKVAPDHIMHAVLRRVRARQSQGQRERARGRVGQEGA